MNTLKLWFSKEIEEEKARSIAGAAKWICRLFVIFFIYSMIIGISGRQTFILHSNTGTYEGMRLVDGRDNEWTRGDGLITASPGTFRLFTNLDNGVDFITRVALSASHMAFALPFGLSFLLLARVLDNVQKGQIFTRANAICLLWFGRVQVVTHLFSPILIFGIIALANIFTDSRIQYTGNPNALVNAIPFLAFNVAAHIILHGVKLQEEVDATV
ncbi:MAG: DUF2975 domain-containing protein [Defluviitaleaceae bacterium]|nr:DUF2975 domain-containing protein [Defluviitaleaceae bacterium]